MSHSEAIQATTTTATTAHHRSGVRPDTATATATTTNITNVQTVKQPATRSNCRIPLTLPHLLTVVLLLI